MNTRQSINAKAHSHIFDSSNPIAKRNTLYATLLTFVTMIVEIFGGWYFNSMALLADGWHMSSHVLALGLAYITYVLATKYSKDLRFNFGTFKIEVLGAYTSAILLLGVAFLMAYHSVERIFNPVSIAYKEAIGIAIVGLLVNLVCAWLLKDDHHHHEHHHEHEHHEHHHDMNLKAAYIHVLADALTSILAIVALVGGMLWGADWLDPVMGIVGSILVFVWALGLIRQSAKNLLDMNMDEHIVDKLIETINSKHPDLTIEDLHVWVVGKGKYASILALRGDFEVQKVKESLSMHAGLVHISIEPLSKGSFNED